ATQAQVIATTSQLDHGRSSSAASTTCSRYRNTNGLAMPPDRYSCAVRVATSTSSPNSSAVLVTRLRGRSIATRLNTASPATTASIGGNGSSIPSPQCTRAMVTSWPTTAIQRTSTSWRRLLALALRCGSSSARSGPAGWAVAGSAWVIVGSGERPSARRMPPCTPRAAASTAGGRAGGHRPWSSPAAGARGRRYHRRMDSPLADVERFLAQTPPFDRLPAAALRRAAGAFQAVYRRAGTVVLRIGERSQTLYLIRRGAVEAHDADGNLAGRYGEGEVFDLQALLGGQPVRFSATLIEDSLLWCMPMSEFDELRAISREFDEYFIRSLEQRPVAALEGRLAGGQAGTLFMTPLGDLVRRGPLSVPPSTPVSGAARTMSEHGVSSLLVGEDGRLDGILTDRDLRNRVVARGLDPSTPVSEVMTPSPLTLEADSPVLSGIVAMAARGIHHLPLVHEGGVVGMVTTRDLLNLQTQH